MEIVSLWWRKRDRAPVLCYAFYGSLKRVLILGANVKKGPTTVGDPKLWSS